ncbi:hypothetical protein DFP72DRAFT_1064382 [Ephemerocybe angulata]|uniref:Uncharacterized protein n=1 Tax=Ephemerocybe angulata TaxID=980116 RepID=A0A8H6MBB3_9AGAR|nr:hypothetical protein DFP72DRAFT_1064382 [Tulosesus angulatus]
MPSPALLDRSHHHLDALQRSLSRHSTGPRRTFLQTPSTDFRQFGDLAHDGPRDFRTCAGFGAAREQCSLSSRSDGSEAMADSRSPLRCIGPGQREPRGWTRGRTREGAAINEMKSTMKAYGRTHRVCAPGDLAIPEYTATGSQDFDSVSDVQASFQSPESTAGPGQTPSTIYRAPSAALASQTHAESIQGKDSDYNRPPRQERSHEHENPEKPEPGKGATRAWASEHRKARLRGSGKEHKASNPVNSMITTVARNRKIQGSHRSHSPAVQYSTTAH